MSQATSESRTGRRVTFTGNQAGPAPQAHDDRPAPDAGTTSSEATEAVMGLDMVLVDGARGPLRRLVPPARTSLRFATALAGRPQVIARQTGEYVKELGRIGVGRSEVAPNKKDRRVANPASDGKPLLP